MLALGLGNMEAFPFVEPPESRHIKDGLTLLKELEAVRELPATGNREGAKLQLMPRPVASSRVSPLILVWRRW
ncbi:hypothetical protein ACLK13_07525 [Escherichia coli]